MTKFYFTDSYSEALDRIEKFILESTERPDLVDAFLIEHDQVLEFIGANPNTAAVHPTTGDQSWVFGNGRYRVFFKAVTTEANSKRSKS